ncbi:hypothetical protein ACQPZX_42760 [Actinoplanes sp. CA-142083]|uniref:hypothetical protein n=1 Tax=Actinoplanes sp. CA-142083 TaxID=3239903 RepID=UPI003D9235D2
MTATTDNPFLNFRDAVELRIAAADQQRLVRRIAVEHPDGRAVPAHTWYQQLAANVAARMRAGNIVLCPHVGPGRSLGPMHCTYTAGPMELQCRTCLAAVPPRLNPIDDNTCDRCGVYSRRGLLIGMLPLGPILIGFGLCRSCAGEIGAGRPETQAA